jgi:hypothetical protein
MFPDSHRFCIAPMMDWTDSLIKSTSYWGRPPSSRWCGGARDDARDYAM